MSAVVTETKFQTQSAPFHFDEDTTYRHWDTQSEKFSSGDALLSALDQGWKIDGVVFRQEYWHAGVRRVPVLHFRLIRGEERGNIIVVENPFITRQLGKWQVQVVRLNQRKTTASNELW